MKILLVQDYLRSGGTERQAVLLAGAFAEAGHATTLLTFRPGGALARTLSDKVSRRILQPFDTKLDWFAPGLLSTATEVAPDVVVCLGRMANCYAGRLQAGLPSAAVISTMRTGKNLPRLFRRSLRQTRHVVANSREAATTLTAQYNVPPERITVIHNSLVFPASQGDTTKAREAARLEHGAGPNTTVMLSVAMFRPEKNQRALVELASGLPTGTDWQLWLAGDGVTRGSCEALVEQKKLRSRIKFLGWQADPSAAYAGADLAVHASTSESLSNFLIEAQARGLPVVAYAAQGNEECVIPGDTGIIVPPGDDSSFRSAVLSLSVATPEERRTRSARARQHARTAFDPQRQVAAYLDLFQKLVSPPRAS